MIRAPTDVEVEHVVIVSELAFFERVVVLEVIVERFADKVLYHHVRHDIQNLWRYSPDSVNDAALRHWPGSHHHISLILELVPGADPISLQVYWALQYACLRGNSLLATRLYHYRGRELHSIPSDSHAASTSGEPICRKIFSFIREPSYRIKSNEVSTSSSKGAETKSATSHPCRELFLYSIVRCARYTAGRYSWGDYCLSTLQPRQQWPSKSTTEGERKWPVYVVLNSLAAVDSLYLCLLRSESRNPPLEELD
jgi:hypothetical protein